MHKRNDEYNIAIVLSAGRGNRMHSDIPKQYLDLCGKPVIAWSLQAFEEFDEVDEVILVCSQDDIEFCRSEIVGRYGFRKVHSIVAGGAERYLSVWEGLQEAARRQSQLFRESEKQYALEGKEPDSYIFIHDGARPLIDGSILSRALEDVREHHACVVGMPVKDTIKISDEHEFAKMTPDRRFLWQVQTPQAFSFYLIHESYRKLIEEGITDVTDDAMVVERESSTQVKLTRGSYRNIKITTPEDLEIAALFLR